MLLAIVFIVILLPIIIRIARDEKRAKKENSNMGKSLHVEIVTNYNGKNDIVRRELLYPGWLPPFDMLSNSNHEDKRAVFYTISKLQQFNLKKIYSEHDLHWWDFATNRKAYNLVIEKGFIQELSQLEEIEKRFSREEMISLLNEKGVNAKGKKAVLAQQLVDTGFRLDRRKYRTRFFRLTEKGIQALQEHQSDRQRAITAAIDALKDLDYSRATSAYCIFDSKWGFVHTSGKKHTIVACYDFPYSRFSFLENYPMRELQNSEDFKSLLRACLIAGLMRGCQDRMELRACFESVCSEKINCPNLLSMFDCEDYILEAMKSNIEANISYALEYYISHVLYLSRGY